MQASLPKKLRPEAALAAAYHRAEPLQNRAPIVIVVCGGAGVTRELLDKWNKQVN